MIPNVKQRKKCNVSHVELPMYARCRVAEYRVKGEWLEMGEYGRVDAG